METKYFLFVLPVSLLILTFFLWYKFGRQKEFFSDLESVIKMINNGCDRKFIFYSKVDIREWQVICREIDKKMKNSSLEIYLSVCPEAYKIVQQSFRFAENYHPIKGLCQRYKKRVIVLNAGEEYILVKGDRKYAMIISENLIFCKNNFSEESGIAIERPNHWMINKYKDFLSSFVPQRESIFIGV